MEAVVLAGGKGTRLRPYTAELPKPLVTVGDRPIIEYLLLRMRRCGVRKVHLAVNHLSHLVMAALGDGRRLGLPLTYWHEPTPLSTIGPLSLIKGLPEHFLVANGDVLTDIDFGAIFEDHVRGGAVLTIAVQERSAQMDYGVVEVGSGGVAVGFREKPTYTFTVSMGIYVLSREALTHVPANRRFGFDDLITELMSQKRPVHTYRYDGFWLDVGRPDDYERANQEIQRIQSWLE